MIYIIKYNKFIIIIIIVMYYFIKIVKFKELDKVSQEQKQNYNERQVQEQDKEVEKKREEDDPNVKELLDMGFSDEQARAALELSKNNLVMI